MNSRKMIYTKQARWYVDLVSAVDPSGRLRCAVILLTPFTRQFIEFARYAKPDERQSRAVALVLRLLEEEKWFRKPRDLRTGAKQLTRALSRVVDIPVRTDSGSARLRAARETFEERTRTMSLYKAWCASDRVEI